MPKVSVIIPTYNREEFICQTIESVLNQTFEDFEIIVIDDGSTDSTKEKLEPFGNKIRLIEQPNSERAVARNNGFKNSTGEYIALVDSDDIWMRDKLEKQVKALDSLKDVIFTYGVCYRIDENNRQIHTAKRQTLGFSGNAFEELLYRNFIVSPTPLARREYIEKIGGFETKYIPYEDWEFWIRFSLLGKFHFLNTPLAYYRVHSSQSVQTVKAEKIEEVTTMLLEDSYKLKEIPEEVIAKSRGLANLRYCYWYLLAKNYDKAREKIDMAMKIYPKFRFDPRWIGLNAITKYPILRKISRLEEFHARW